MKLMSATTAPPQIINNFGVVLGTKGYLEYLIFKRRIIVCEFPALDTIHLLNTTHNNNRKPFKKLSEALIKNNIAYAKLKVSSPDKLEFKIPVHLLKPNSPDPSLRSDLLWLANYIEQSFEVEIHAEFLKNKKDQIVIKSSYCANVHFLRIAIDSFY